MYLNWRCECTFAINLLKYNTCYVETFYICVRMSHPNQRGGGEWIWTLAVNTFPGFHPRPQSRDQQDAELRWGQTELVTNLGEVWSFHNILVESSYNQFHI